ncbi:MAG TPA: glycoside hydrolase family 95 protein [Verrucomicrobiae bacterium]|nr:glycoside hydrolase family 95 protein [Verrucomicrobiae bacterium]
MLALFALALFSARGAETNSLKLWFAQPAEKWTDALPIGNGRMGAMIFGRVPDERVQFNEDTLWTGRPHDYVRAGAREQLPKIRQLLFAGKVKEAEQLAREKFLSDPVRQKAYQPFGELHFHFLGQTNVTDYRRELDLNSAIARVIYRADGVTYTREAFASYPDHVIVLRFTADQPGQIGFTLTLDSPQTNSQTRAIALDTLVLAGQVETGGLKFESRVRVTTEGGTVRTNGDTLSVEHADSATVLLVAATSFRNFQDIGANPDARCARALAALAGRDYPALLARHEADYQKLFDRLTLNLGRTDRADLPTDERLKRVQESGLAGDPALAALYFQFGRYLLIASSRPGGQPANLQGIWNDQLDPPWESKWTLNINCEMNYWPAEVCNLSECALPLFAMINDLTVSGARTAREQYGCRGWVVHHNTDLWRGSAPINGIDGIWPTGGAWLCDHLWEHYLFTDDRKFLARVYPELKSASQFFVDFLVKDPKTGWLVTCPSYSPEQGDLCYGPTMDNQLIRALFNETIAAAKILGRDRAFSAKLARMRDQLPPNQVGRYGQLQEWLDDIDRPNNQHRHMSPLWALYPGADISPADPKIWNAAKVLLKWRGDGSTGWSYAWRIALWSRVGNGEFAYRQLNLLFQRKTLPNLFDLCGPFQIDGNFGATAGIAEMLLQSQWTKTETGNVEAGKPETKVRILNLLPALPREWPTGSATGLCARGGFVVDLDWKDGALTRAVIHSRLGGSCLLRYGGRDVELQTRPGGQYLFQGN